MSSTERRLEQCSNCTTAYTTFDQFTVRCDRCKAKWFRYLERRGLCFAAGNTSLSSKGTVPYTPRAGPFVVIAAKESEKWLEVIRKAGFHAAQASQAENLCHADEEELRAHLILAAVLANPNVNAPTWKAYFETVMRNAKIDWLNARMRYVSTHKLGGDRIETLTIANEKA